jgi:hypothetical protein
VIQHDKVVTARRIKPVDLLWIAAVFAFWMSLFAIAIAALG